MQQREARARESANVRAAFGRCGTALALVVSLLLVVGLRPSQAQGGVRYLTPGFSDPGAVTVHQYMGTGPYDDAVSANWDLLDRFTDPAGTTLSDHVVDGRRPWRDPSGVYAVDAAGRVATSDTTMRAAATTTDLPSGDMDVWATVRPTGNANRVLFRAAIDPADDSIDQYWFVELRTLTNRIAIGRVDGASIHWLPTTAAVAFPAGSPVRVHVVATGSSITATVLTDAAQPAALGSLSATVNVPYATNTGVGFAGVAGGWFDEVKVWRPQLLDLQLPLGQADPPALAVVIHGGSFSSGDKSDMVDERQALVGRGYAVASVNYRTRLSYRYAADLVPNSLAVDLDATAGTWTLEVAGGPAISGLAHDVSAGDLSAAVATALGRDPATVQGWTEAGAPERRWISFTGPVPDVSTVTTALTGTATVVPLDDMTDQFEAGSVCRNSAPWLPAVPGIDTHVGEGCFVATVMDLYHCAIGHGGEWPPAVPVASGDDCNRGALLAAQQLVRPAVDDAQAAVRWLKINASALGFRDDRIVATGESAGGILSTSLAYRPVDWTGGPEDATGPNQAPGIDATIDGAAPYAGGWMVNGPSAVPADAPPVAYVQRDVDTVLWQGAMQGYTLDLLTRAQAAGRFGEYHGLCGVGHGGSPARTPNDMTQQEFDQIVGEIATFLEPIAAGRPGPAREGIWFGGTASGTYTARPAAELVGTSTPLAGDFDGDGRDDLYWRSADGSCDSLWLGREDMTFRPAPTANPNLPVGLADGPAIVGAPGAGTKVAVGDFNADGADDLFWYGTEAAPDAVWFGGAPSQIGGSPSLFSRSTITIGGAYSALVVGDFGWNGSADGAQDVYLLGASDGADLLLYGSAAGTFSEVAVGSGYSAGAGTVKPLVGNFDGDALDDIVWLGSGAAPDAVWYGQHLDPPGAAFDQRSLVIGEYRSAVVGDFGNYGISGAPKDDLYLFDLTTAPFTGFDLLYYGYGVRSVNAGLYGLSMLAGYATSHGQDVTPIAVNLDGDAWDDLVWYNRDASPGETDLVWWGAANDGPSKSAANAFVEGAPLTIAAGYAPVVGDFDGQGGADVNWYQPSG